MNNKSTLLLFLARNPDTINTPQTNMEAYHQHWTNSYEQNRDTISECLNSCSGVKRSLRAILLTPCFIGTTKFALETCEMLGKSKIIDWDWFKKNGASAGIEVCAFPVIRLSQANNLSRSGLESLWSPFCKHDQYSILYLSLRSTGQILSLRSRVFLQLHISYSSMVQKSKSRHLCS